MEADTLPQPSGTSVEVEDEPMNQDEQISPQPANLQVKLEDIDWSNPEPLSAEILEDHDRYTYKINIF